MKIDISKIVGAHNYGASRVGTDYVLTELEKLGYKLDEQNKNITLLIVRYFLRHPEFVKSEMINNVPGFHKGLFVFGDYGVGKTMLFESLNKIGKKLLLDRGIQDLWFSCISTVSFVNEYMTEVDLPKDVRKLYLPNYYKGRLYIDDLGFENKAFNSYELFSDLLFERNRNSVKTFVTTNLKPSEITARYGMRIGDRLPEMFNIINWKGESYRK